MAKEGENIRSRKSKYTGWKEYERRMSNFRIVHCSLQKPLEERCRQSTGKANRVEPIKVQEIVRKFNLNRKDEDENVAK